MIDCQRSQPSWLVNSQFKPVDSFHLMQEATSLVLAFWEIGSPQSNWILLQQLMLGTAPIGVLGEYD